LSPAPCKRDKESDDNIECAFPPRCGWAAGGLRPGRRYRGTQIFCCGRAAARCGWPLPSQRALLFRRSSSDNLLPFFLHLLEACGPPSALCARNAGPSEKSAGFFILVPGSKGAPAPSGRGGAGSGRETRVGLTVSWKLGAAGAWLINACGVRTLCPNLQVTDQLVVSTLKTSKHASKSAGAAFSGVIL